MEKRTLLGWNSAQYLHDPPILLWEDSMAFQQPPELPGCSKKYLKLKYSSPNISMKVSNIELIIERFLIFYGKLNHLLYFIS